MYSVLRNCLPVLLLAAPLATQAPAAADLSIGVVPIRAQDDGTVWAATDSYKASFHGDPTFVPYLGADYPENRPLRWRTTSVRIGGRELLLPDEEPDRWHSATRYEYRYGAVTEEYDVLEAGLEQTFTFPKRLSGNGDLVITGRITTELFCEATSGEAQALTFRDGAGRAITRYGAAIVIDADGREGPVRTTLRPGVVELSVSASWLEEARYPIVVDPLLSRVSVSLNSQEEYGSVDVAFQERSDKISVVHTAAASSIDRDVFAKLFDSDWTRRQTVFTELTTRDTPHVRVAATSASSRMFALVFQLRTSSVVLGTRLWRSGVVFHAMDAGTGSQTGHWPVPVSPGTHLWRPDIAGVLSQNAIPATFVVVLQREASGNWFQNTASSRIEVLLTDHLSVRYRTGLSSLAAGSDDHERPSISDRGADDSIGFTEGWMAVWQERQSSFSGDDWNVVGKRLELRNGTPPLTVSSTPWVSSGGAIRSHHRMGPQVGGMGGRYLVAFTRSPLTAVPTTPSGVAGHTLCTERVDWFGPHAPPVTYPEHTVRGPFPSARILVGGCAADFWNRQHWAITSHRLRANGGDGSVHIDRVGYTGRVTESAVLHAASGNVQGVAGGVCFDEPRERWYTAWAANGGLAHRVYANTFSYNPVQQPVLGGTSCSTASSSWIGMQQIGSEWERARLSNAQPNRLALLLVALTTADIDLTPYQMPFCRALVPLSGNGFLGMVGRMTGSNGRAQVDLPLPEYLAPFTLHLQWFHAQDNANPVGLVSTRRLTVPLSK